MSKTLKPCPFCGNTDVCVYTTRDGEHEVVCAGSNGCSSSTGHSPARARVVDAWNRRAPDPALAEAVAVLREIRAWRRSGVGLEPRPNTDPGTLGERIDAALVAYQFCGSKNDGR
jgi:Lar family restriction alleviation protein